MFALSLLFACSGLTAYQPAPDGLDSSSVSEEVVLHPETRLLDAWPGVDELIVEPDRLVLSVTDATPMIEVGAVVVGQRGGGYLRRVEAVQLDGGTMVLETSPARLTDAVESGRVAALLQLDPNRSSSRRFDFGGRVLLDETLWSDEAQNEVTVRIQTADDAHARWEPTIDYDLDIDFWSVDARFDSTFTFDVEADFVATVSGAYTTDQDVHLLTQAFPFTFMMGEVPVWGEATVALYAELELEAMGEVEAIVHSEAHARVDANAAFYDSWGPNNRRWETGIGGGIEGADDGRFLWTEASGEGFAHARIAVRAEVTMELYGAAGAIVVVEPAMELDTCDDPLAFAVRAGIEGTHQYYFEALGWTLYDSDPMPFAIGPWTMAECPEG